MDQEGKESISERVVTKEREFEDDCYTHIVLFTAGIAVLMACFKRALMVFLLEEWRAWVFLFLNLVLLAILFTSTLSTPKEEGKECRRDNNVDQGLKNVERDKKIKRQSSSKCWSEDQQGIIECEDESEDFSHKKIDGGTILSTKSCGIDEKVCSGEDDQMEAPRLSKEELNERVEAFIVMFRQHLVLDARRCGKDYLFQRPERVERVKFQTCPR